MPTCIKRNKNTFYRKRGMSSTTGFNKPKEKEVGHQQRKRVTSMSILQAQLIN